MAKRTLFLIVACLGVALTVGMQPAAAGKQKELAFAVSLARKGLWREAAFRFQALARRDPRNARLWNNLAVAYEASGRYEEAHEAYEKAAALPTSGGREPLELNRSAFEAFYVTWANRPSSSVTDDETDKEDGG